MDYKQFLSKINRTKDVLAALQRYYAENSELVAKYLAFHKIEAPAQFFLDVLPALARTRFISAVLLMQNVSFAQFCGLRDIALILLHNQRDIDIEAVFGHFLDNLQATSAFDPVFLDFIEEMALRSDILTVKRVFRAIQQHSRAAARLFAGFGAMNADISWRMVTFSRLLPLMGLAEIATCCQMCFLGTARDEPTLALATRVVERFMETPLQNRYQFRLMRQAMRHCQSSEMSAYLLEQDNLNSILLCEIAHFDAVQCRKYVEKALECLELDIPSFVSDVIVENARKCFENYQSKLFAQGIVKLLENTKDDSILLATALDASSREEMAPSLLQRLRFSTPEKMLQNVFLILASGRFNTCYEQSEQYFQLFDALSDKMPVYEMLQCMPHFLRANRQVIEQPDFCEKLLSSFQFKHAKTAIAGIYSVFEESDMRAMRKIALSGLKHENREIRLAAAFFLQDADLLQFYFDNAQYKQVKIAVLYAIWFAQRIRTSHIVILKNALQDTDFDVRKTALKASQLAIMHGTYADCVDLLGLAFGCIFSEQFCDEMKVLERCSSKRADFDIFEEYLIPLLFSGNYMTRASAWAFLDVERFGLSGALLGNEK